MLVGGSVKSVEGTLVVLADASGDNTIELVGDAAPLAATLKVGDLVNATGKVGASGHVIVADPADLVRVGVGGSTSAPASIGAVDYQPQTHQIAGAQPAQIGPLVAFVAILGLTVLLVVGGLAWKLGWANRLVKRRGRI